MKTRIYTAPAVKGLNGIAIINTAYLDNDYYLE